MNCWRQEHGLKACGETAVILDIPDVRQRNGHDCGKAALEAFFLFHGITPARWLKHLPNPVQGTSPDTVEAVLWSTLGNVCRGTMDSELLRYWTRRGLPVLAPITHPVHGGHWVCVSGVSRGRVHFHCPIDGASTMRLSDWNAAWLDNSCGSPYIRFGLTGWPE